VPAYTGQRIDPETNGLYYYPARHYMPARGRFMQADPIVRGAGGGAAIFMDMSEMIHWTQSNPNDAGRGANF